MVRIAALLPLTLLVSACTITTYSNEPPPPPRPANRGTPAANPAQTAQPAKTGGGIHLRGGAAAAGAGAGAGGSDTTPRINAPIPFGGPTPAAFRGLAYVVPPDSKKLPDFATMVPFAMLFTDQFNVASQEFTAGFPGALAGQVEFFGIRYDGRFTIPTDGNWQFKLTSDDGAILSIDGAKVIDNDGVHTATAATGQANLKAGAHTLRLDYFQAKGPVALQLVMVVNGQDRPLLGTK